MLHDNASVMADNGVQVFLACDIEKILADVYAYDYSSGSRVRRYTDAEICEDHSISQSELDRMKHRLSYEYCHDKNGNYKFS